MRKRQGTPAKKPKREDLIKVYKIINKIISDSDYYYKNGDVGGKEKL